MSNTLLSLLACAALFLGMWGAELLGRRIARAVPLAPERADSMGVVVNAVFALLGLLVAFTFSAAFARLDSRRGMIVEEANAIGTAYLRLDLLPAEAQPSLREKFRRYTTSRARVLEVLKDADAARAELSYQAELQRAIWRETIAATPDSANPVRILVLPALNAMFDITTTRLVASRTHSPLLVIVTLFAFALACAMLAAYTASARGGPSRVHSIAFAAVTAFAIYVILDVEFPSYGFVRLDAYNRVLFDLVETMRQ